MVFSQRGTRKQRTRSGAPSASGSRRLASASSKEQTNERTSTSSSVRGKMTLYDHSQVTQSNGLTTFKPGKNTPLCPRIRLLSIAMVKLSTDFALFVCQTYNALQSPSFPTIFGTEDGDCRASQERPKQTSDTLQKCERKVDWNLQLHTRYM